jgi:hypothetical protein
MGLRAGLEAAEVLLLVRIPIPRSSCRRPGEFCDWDFGPPKINNKSTDSYRLLLLLLLTALQLLMQSFDLLGQFLPSSSILDKGSPIWHF